MVAGFVFGLPLTLSICERFENRFIAKVEGERRAKRKTPTAEVFTFNGWLTKTTFHGG